MARRKAEPDAVKRDEDMEVKKADPGDMAAEGSGVASQEPDRATGILGLGALAERTLAEIMLDGDAGAANRLKAAQLAMERAPVRDGAPGVAQQARRLAALLRGAGRSPEDGG